GDRGARGPRRMEVPHVNDGIDMKDRVVIVTGASRGVGRGIALHLARLGAHLVVTGRKPERLEALGEEIGETGTDYLSSSLNVADRDGAFALVAETIERFGKVDGLVANAQTFRPVTPLADVTPSDMDLLIDTG